LNRSEVAYLRLVYQLMPSGNMDISEFNEAHLSDALVSKIREVFRHTVIWCGGFSNAPLAVSVRSVAWFTIPTPQFGDGLPQCN